MRGALAAIFALAAPILADSECPQQADVLVYGATAAGVLAAVAAANESNGAGGNVSVVLLEPRGHVGGMVSGGLSQTDLGTTTDVIGGRTRQFFLDVTEYYTGSKSEVKLWNFEPKVAAQLLSGYLVHPNICVALNTRIVSVTTAAAAAAVDVDDADGRISDNSAADMRGDRSIISVTTANGTSYSAAVFIDATYEGALLPLTNVSYASGREANTTFNESVAGVTPEPHNASTPDHPFTSQPQLYLGISGVWPNGSSIPLLTPAPGPVGSADMRTQAYNYRVTLTTNPNNMAPWTEPEGYDASQYELFRRLFTARKYNGSIVPDVVHSPLPCLPSENATRCPKMDWNGQNFDGYGISWPYPDAVARGDWEGQQAVWEAQAQFMKGLFYFLATDPSLEPGVHLSMSKVGLPLDEFVDTGHFPPQLYVREALRLQGDYIFTQADREVNVNKSDTIGMGAYTVDIIHVSAYADATYGVLQEGGLQAPSFLTPGLAPFQVPYRAFLPKRQEANNLLVPVAVSSSHIGFCAIRLEPTWMTLGESAGVAAAQAVAAKVAVQDVDVQALQMRLRSLGQVLELP